MPGERPTWRSGKRLANNENVNLDHPRQRTRCHPSVWTEMAVVTRRTDRIGTEPKLSMTVRGVRRPGRCGGPSQVRQPVSACTFRVMNQG